MEKEKEENTLEMNQPCPFTSKMSKQGFRKGKWVPQLYSCLVEEPERKYHLNTQYHRRSGSPGLLYAGQVQHSNDGKDKMTRSQDWRLNLLRVASETNSRSWRDLVGPFLYDNIQTTPPLFVSATLIFWLSLGIPKHFLCRKTTDWCLSN